MTQPKLFYYSYKRWKAACINLFSVFSSGNGGETFVVRQDENQRRAEFRKNIDLNGDGKADRRELLHYIAPQSPRHSEHEAEALLALADSNHDNLLSLDEILNHPDLFLKSKMVDTGRSFHDEFWKDGRVLYKSWNQKWFLIIGIVWGIKEGFFDLIYVWFFYVMRYLSIKFY